MEEPKKETRRSALRGCLLMVAGAVLLVIIVIVVGWGPFVRFGVSSDINDYIEKIDAIGDGKPSNDELVQRLVAIRERVREGHYLGLMRWMDYNTSIQSMLNDGVLTDGERARLAQELESLERQK